MAIYKFHLSTKGDNTKNKYLKVQNPCDPGILRLPIGETWTHRLPSERQRGYGLQLNTTLSLYLPPNQGI